MNDEVATPHRLSRPARPPLRVVDVFSGAGGLWLGWSMAVRERGRTFELVGVADEDPYLKDVYAANAADVPFIEHTFSPTPNDAEVRQLARKLNVDPGEIDVLLAGPPCQTLSAAGKRDEEHADNRLAHRVCDLATFLQPKIVILENVPEFRYINDGRLLGRIRVQLARTGYVVDTLTLNATAFGVPQVRIRCFLVAIRRDVLAGRLMSTLRPTPTHLHVERVRPDGDLRSAMDRALPLIKVDIPTPPTVAEAIADLPSLQAGDGEEESTWTSEASSAYQRALRDSSGALYNHVATSHSVELQTLMASLKPGDTPQRMLDHPLRRKDYFRSAYARLDPAWVAPTMTTNTHNPGSGRFTHYRDDRVLTVREVARIQSFPDSFRFVGDQRRQRRHVGNAVPPFLSRAIARSVLDVLDD